MVGEPVLEILKNFGSFGMALAVVGGAFWGVWKKIVEPQQRIAREATEKHIATLGKIIEAFEERNSKYSEIEKEHLDVLRRLNGKVTLVTEKTKTHDDRMGREHDRISQEVKAN